MLIILMVILWSLIQTVTAEDELEVFAGQDKTGRVDTPVHFNDAQIIKPSPLDPEKTYELYWDFDNRNDSNLDSVFDNDNDSIEMYTEWTYWVPGTYIVTLTVWDGEFTSKDTLQVTVRANQPPEIWANDTEAALVGVEHVFFAEAVDDMNPAHLLRWNWSFGDGTTSDDPPSVSHTYIEEGMYTVVIKVADTDGAWTEHEILLNVTIPPKEEPTTTSPPDFKVYGSYLIIVVIIVVVAFAAYRARKMTR